MIMMQGIIWRQVVEIKFCTGEGLERDCNCLLNSAYNIIQRMRQKKKEFQKECRTIIIRLMRTACLLKHQRQLAIGVG
jgi:hypothetical protein